LAKLIEVKNLKTNFYTIGGVVRAVNGVDFAIEREKTLGVVGESGCGKSVTALSIMRLIQPPGMIDEGEILFHQNGKVLDLTKLNAKGPIMRSIRGNEIAMIFQEPMTSLNPVFTIGDQIMESIMLHQRLGKDDAREKAVGMLKAVGIPSPEVRIGEYPHQLSGGMRQRAMIAMAISCNPSLLIADEPTTALDVTIQAQVLNLMNKLRSDFQAAIMFITHDLGVIAHMADDVIVMYLGRIVELAKSEAIFSYQLHPYTIALISALPRPNPRKKTDRILLEGDVPSPTNPPSGCTFHLRCTDRQKICTNEVPELVKIEKDHFVACHFPRT